MSVISVPLSLRLFKLRSRDLESARPGRESFGGENNSRMAESFRPRIKLKSKVCKGGQRHVCSPSTDCTGVPCKLRLRSPGMRVIIQFNCLLARIVQSRRSCSGCRLTIAINRFADNLYCEQSMRFQRIGSTDTLHHCLQTSEQLTKVSKGRYLNTGRRHVGSRTALELAIEVDVPTGLTGYCGFLRGLLELLIICCANWFRNVDFLRAGAF